MSGLFWITSFEALFGKASGQDDFLFSSFGHALIVLVLVIDISTGYATPQSLEIVIEYVIPLIQVK